MYIRLYTVHIQNTCDNDDQNKTLFSHNKVEIENTTKNFISNKKRHSLDYIHPCKSSTDDVKIQKSKVQKRKKKSKHDNMGVLIVIAMMTK